MRINAWISGFTEGPKTDFLIGLLSLTIVRRQVHVFSIEIMYSSILEP